MLLPEKVLEIATKEVGVQEVPRGSNSGPRVNQYLAVVHLAPGNPWCAAFVCWCIQQATAAVGGPPQFKFSGSALGLLRQNPNLIVAAPGSDACYVGILENADHIHGHAVLWVPGQLTVEGNSNDEGSHEGYEVCRLVRQVEKFKGIIRIG